MLGILLCQVGWLLWLSPDFSNWVATTNKSHWHFVRVTLTYATSWLFWDFVAIENRILLYSIFTVICGVCWLWSYTQGWLSVLLQWLLNFCLLVPWVVPQSMISLAYPRFEIHGLSVRLDWQLSLLLLCYLNYRLPPFWLKNNIKVSPRQIFSLSLFCGSIFILAGQLLGLWQFGFSKINSQLGWQLWWVIVYSSLAAEIFLRRVLQAWLNQSQFSESHLFVCGAVFLTVVGFCVHAFGVKESLMLGLLTTGATWIFLQNQSVVSSWFFQTTLAVVCWLFFGKLLYLI